MKITTPTRDAGAGGVVAVFAALLLLMVCTIAPVSAAELPDEDVIFIEVANPPVQYDSPLNGTYMIYFAGGGLNALHITTNTSESFGQVTTTDEQSGTFYVADTGGKGGSQDILLMIAVNGTIPDDFSVEINASGYTWGEIIDSDYHTLTDGDITYETGAVDLTLTKDNFTYGPQTWKPYKAGEPLPVHYGQDMSDADNTFQLLFADLHVGALNPAKIDAIDSLTDNGLARIEYSISNLGDGEIVAFNAYSYRLSADYTEFPIKGGSGWTNDVSAASSKPSGYVVSAPETDVLFNGTVSLGEGNVTVTSSQGNDYSIPVRTPLGALDTVADCEGFSYAVSDKKWDSMGILLLDDIGAYPYVKGGNSWVCYVNGNLLDDYGNPTTEGLNVYALQDGDVVDYYYGADGVTAETAEAAVHIVVSTSSGPDVLYSGVLPLPEGNVTVTSSQGNDYSIPVRTPLGALDAAAQAGNFTYAVTDKKWDSMGILLLDDIGAYPYVKGGNSWVCYVNGNLLDDYSNPTTEGLNVYALQDGDKIVYCYGPDGVTAETAEATVEITASLTAAEIIYSGELTIGDGNVTVTSTEGSDYSIPVRTPLGVLDTASTAGNFTYAVTDKKWDSMGILLLNDIGAYPYVKGGNSWVCYVNGNLLDDYGNPSTEGLNVYALVNGDKVAYYYGADTANATTAEAAVLITVKTGAAPGDWTLEMGGAQNVTVTKAYFESGITCGHGASWTDPENSAVWEGMPLWYLVGMVDDVESGGHYTFNDALAAEGYSVKVTSSDGYSVNIPSAEMARNNGFILANTLNGSVLPETIGDKNKPCWPLQIKGANASAGQLVGGIASIELVGLPDPSEGWTLKVCGVVNDTITQEEFEEFGCHGGVNYTDNQGIVWTGVPLWYLVGVSDNLETTDHWTFDDALAATNYTIKVIASDGWSQEYGSVQVAESNGYILANLMDGQPIPETDSSYPLKLVGDDVPKKVKSVAEIDLVNLIPAPPVEGEWNLQLLGKIDYTCTEAFFEEAVACPHHTVTWTNQETGETWGGIALWELCGFVDDRIPHGSDGFNDGVATAGYTVIVTASDGYSKEFSSKDLARNNNYIVANTLNGTPLSQEGSKAPWPLRLVGSDVSGSNSVGAIASIELTDFQKPTEIPTIHVVSYDADGTTIIDEITVDYTWMEENLPVYGDGETVYHFQGPTFDPDDLWNPAEDKNAIPGKVFGAVMGTSIKDLCDLVGGMSEGTEIVLEATDGYKTKMNYTNIYSPLDRQGTAILAWYKADEGYIPDYANGYRLYFTTPDTIFGNEDMRLCLDEAYWHYYWNEGIQYPSAAGISARNVATVKIYHPEKDWSLSLEGTISTDMSKHYFEEGIACEASHRATYTDTKGRVWEGMPFWRIIGWVDDDNEHSGAAFNDTMAAMGYTIHVIAGDGYEQTFTSQEIARNNNYILANSVDGHHIDAEDSAWPLKLVGINVSGNGKAVKNVVRIAFIPPNEGQEEVIETGNITAGDEKDFPVSNSTFSNITLKAASDISGAEFAVSTVAKPPASEGTPNATVYSYVHVVYPSAQEAIAEALITFSIPTDWLSANNIGVGDVILYRRHNDTWTELQTTYVETRDGAAWFEATTPGFSYFAVGGVSIQPTPTPTPTPTPVPSSGGGGSSSASAVSGSIPAGGSMTFSITDTSIARITVDAKDQISGMLLTVQKAGLPTGMAMPDGEVYEIEQITVYRADSASIAGAELTFAVESSWLTAHGLTTADVALMHEVDGAWQTLETTFVEERDGKAYFTARTPGFSYFAIVGVKGAAIPAETTPVPVTTSAPAAEATTVPATTAPATTPAQSPVFWALPFIALGALLILRRK
ncbi:PGF-pre-PGF domain-containing protein [Methanofollis fontis]|nr:PGF-pre-PGF domain-containing protein [Methanofollis fontis]